MKLKLFLIAFALLCAVPAFAKERVPSAAPVDSAVTEPVAAPKPPTVITAQSFHLKGDEKIIIYEKDVVVDDTETVLFCDKMTLYGKTKPAEESTDSALTREPDPNAGNSMFGGTAGNQLDHIDFDGNVVIIRKTLQPDGSWAESQRATAGKAVYYAENERFILLDKPVVTQGLNKMTGSELVLYRASMEVTGKNVVTTITMDQPRQTPPRESNRPKLNRQ